MMVLCFGNNLLCPRIESCFSMEAATASKMSSIQKKFLVRLARQEDKQALEELVGRTLHSPLNDTLIAMEFERGPILGALSYSKIYSTWEGRSIGLNSLQVKDEACRVPLLNELTKMSVSLGCSRIDCQTADDCLISTLTTQNVRDLTEEEKWHCWELDNLAKFVTTDAPAK
ncbi:diamine acetyltransferase 2-like [Varroa destructor]|uniref:N-acetyltransferase domain-containing protein n=1 Tax=Varroa destructor TaxID=109461 RepID=A0A7M7KTG3_VARDE|nr:diamine acetyltransferase 2-like [Varroa destructor]